MRLMNRRIRNRTYGGVRGGGRKAPAYSLRYPELKRSGDKRPERRFRDSEIWGGAGRTQRKNSSVIAASTGSSAAADQARYPKNDGIFTPACSAIALTMKFGPLPM